MDSREEYLRKFGDHLTFLRQQKGLSIAQLAEMADLECDQLREIEEGKINVLFTTIHCLSQALDVPPEDLLETL